MIKNLKPTLITVTFGVVLFVVLMNFGAITGTVSDFFQLIMPIITGLIIAFILSVPMRGLEKIFTKLFTSKKAKKSPNETFISAISLVVTFAGVLFLLVLTVTLVVPALTDSLESLYAAIMKKWPEWAAVLKEYGIDTAAITAWLNSLNIKSIIEKLTSYAGSIISSTAGAIGTAVGVLTDFGISLIIAVYVLMSKKLLCAQMRKVVNAYTKQSVADYIFHVSELINKAYSKFLSGQCIEAAILGTLIFLAFTVFGIPYAGLTGILAAICSFIPYVGAFIACVVGAFLVLIAAPGKFILCIIVYLVVQFVENQFIYPHVVGSSVGMSAMWTMIAVLIGGSLLGLFGMIFFIPMMAVILTLFKEYTQTRLDKKLAVKEAADN